MIMPGISSPSFNFSSSRNFIINFYSVLFGCSNLSAFDVDFEAVCTGWTMLKKEKKDEVLPIEKRKIKGHIKHVVLELPGLNEQWVTPRKFIHYVFPPSKLPNGDHLPGAKQKWLESMSHLLDDIWWLCELEYHRFWSQIMFDTNSMNGVNSFLHLAPLQQLYFKIDDQPMLLLYKKIKKAVFQFMKRLLRVKESDLNFMSPEKYSEIMKKYNLVPASVLFCLCTLYAKKESETVREMIVHVVQHNGNLKLDSCVVRSIQLFSRMKTKLKNNYRDLKKNLRHSKKSDYIREAMNAYRQNLSSSVQFLANAAVNISSFLHVYAEGCEIFLAHDFDFHIIRVYKKLIIPTYFEISVLFGDDMHIQSSSRLISMLELTRVEFVKSFHVCLQALIDKLGTRILAYETLQRIVQLLKMALKLENFLIDSNSLRCFNEIHELVKKKCLSDIDLTVINNVFESIKEELNTTKQEPDPEENSIEDNHIYNYICDDYDLGSDNSESENDEEEEVEELSFGDNSSEYSDWSKNENSDGEYECYLEEEDSSAKKSPLSLEPVPSTSSTKPISELDLQSAISQVKDLLPHLGDGFIAICLKAYNMNVATVINVILENTLLPSLNEVDFSLSKIPSDILEEIQPEYEDIPSTSTADKSGLVEFKRVEYTSYKEMFNDKEAVNQAKNIYEKYRNTEEDELYNDDVDEDYEEQFFAPPVEVDPEGFYTEYATIPTHNPNHLHEEELEENCELDHATYQQSSENTQAKYARNSPPDRSFHKQKGSNSRGNFKESNNRDEHRNRKEDSNYSQKSSNSWRNSGPTREKQNDQKLSNSSQNHDRKRLNSWRNSEVPKSNEYRETQNRDRKPLNSWRNSERNDREEPIRDRRPPNSSEYSNPGNRETQYRDRENLEVRNREERDTDRYHHDRKPLDFCENPELIRARVAHQYQLKQEKRRGSKQHTNSQFSKSTSSTQEGGDDREQRERHFKNVHKSNNANHSRKFHSDRKRKQF